MSPASASTRWTCRCCCGCSKPCWTTAQRSLSSSTTLMSSATRTMSSTWGRAAARAAAASWQQARRRRSGKIRRVLPEDIYNKKGAGAAWHLPPSSIFLFAFRDTAQFGTEALGNIFFPDIFDEIRKLCGLAYGIDHDALPMLRRRSKQKVNSRKKYPDRNISRSAP